jgi:Protein of unknown function DUF262.
MNQTELEVREFTPQKISDRKYSIPLYQRLYSWEEEQVKQLLDVSLRLSTYNHK